MARKGSSKIPLDLHTSVFGWHCQGLKQAEIVAKLQLEHGVMVNRKAVGALVESLRAEKEKQVGSVLVDRAAESVEKDFSNLEKLEARLEKLAVKGDKDDPDLLLRTADRQLKLYQLKLAITSDNKGQQGPSKESLLDALLGKAGGRK